jgi:hypothetical protein
MLHDMSKEFWNAAGWILFFLALALPAAGWWLGLDRIFIFGTFFFCFLGAGYMAQLGRFSRSRTEQEESEERTD